MSRPYAWCCLALALTAGLVLASAEAAEVTWRVAAINAATTRSFTDFLVPLQQALEEESGGRIEIKLGGLGVYGKPVELLGLLESGKVEIASTAPGYHADRFQRMSVLDLPLLFETAEQGSYVAWKMYEEGFFSAELKGLKLLALFPVTPYGIFTNVPVANLRDLRGLRIRASSVTAGQALNRLAVISLGLTPDAMGPSLTQGLIDGVSYSYDSAAATPGDGGKMLIEQLKYLVDARMGGGASMIVMRQETYDGLPADLRALMDRTFGFDLSVRGGRLRDQWEADTRSRLEREGGHVFVSLTADERAELGRRVQPMLDDWLANMASQGIDGKALLERAREIARQHPPVPAIAEK